ncbi:MAG TPA: efflux RND transporter periplasmic adaptor subunit [Candidatus Acidoferrales bacterium]|nr:efflux RND transporter periplasmic adaptor subunit [Candidatus Acidoferrales bacterium]
MAERKRGPAAVIRSIVLLIVLGVAGYFVWRAMTHREAYTGGDVVTTGTISSVHVQLGFQVEGRIAAVPVAEGDRVPPGEVVGRLATEDFDVQIQAAQASLESARAALAQSRANHEKAAQDLARMRSLLASAATTPQQMDAAQAEASVTTAQVEAAQAQVHSAETALAQAKLRRSYTVLSSPQGGIVAERVHEPGEMVMAGTPVVTIEQSDTIKVLAAVDETRVGAVRPGDRVDVHVYTFDRRTFPGVVTDIEPAGDFATRKDWGAQRRDIRTFTVTALLPNPDHLLKDGMTADVTIHVSPAVQSMAGAKP